MRERTAPAACLSEGPSANCMTVTKTNRHGARAGCPRLENSSAKCSSSQIVLSSSLILV